MLRNIITGVIEVAKLKSGYKLLKPSKIDEYDFFDLLGITGNHEQFFRDNAETIFLNCEPIKYANWINSIPKRHGVSIITSQFKGLEGLTLDWLKNNNINYDSIHFTWDKNMVSVDLLVDDYIENLKLMPDNVIKVCYDAPYNKNWTGLRTKNMKDFVKYVLPRIESNHNRKV